MLSLYIKNGASHSDMTIADYWAAKVVDKDFDDDKGLGLVILYSEKEGRFCLDWI